MEALLTILIVIAWFGFGAIGALACLRSFQRKFGRTVPWLAVVVFLVGPIGAIDALIMGAYRWQVSTKSQTDWLTRYVERTATVENVTKVDVTRRTVAAQIEGIKHTAEQNLKYGDPTIVCTDSETILELCRLAELGRLAEQATNKGDPT